LSQLSDWNDLKAQFDVDLSSPNMSQIVQEWPSLKDIHAFSLEGVFANVDYAQCSTSGVQHHTPQYRKLPHISMMCRPPSGVRVPLRTISSASRTPSARSSVSPHYSSQSSFSGLSFDVKEVEDASALKDALQSHLRGAPKVCAVVQFTNITPGLPKFSPCLSMLVNNERFSTEPLLFPQYRIMHEASHPGISANDGSGSQQVELVTEIDQRMLLRSVFLVPFLTKPPAVGRDVRFRILLLSNVQMEASWVNREPWESAYPFRYTSRVVMTRESSGGPSHVAADEFVKNPHFNVVFSERRMSNGHLHVRNPLVKAQKLHSPRSPTGANSMKARTMDKLSPRAAMCDTMIYAFVEREDKHGRELLSPQQKFMNVSFVEYEENHDTLKLARKFMTLSESREGKFSHSPSAEICAVLGIDYQRYRDRDEQLTIVPNPLRPGEEGNFRLVVCCNRQFTVRKVDRTVEWKEFIKLTKKDLACAISAEKSLGYRNFLAYRTNMCFRLQLSRATRLCIRLQRRSGQGYYNFSLLRNHPNISFHCDMLMPQYEVVSESLDESGNPFINTSTYEVEVSVPATAWHRPLFLIPSPLERGLSSHFDIRIVADSVFTVQDVDSAPTDFLPHCETFSHAWTKRNAGGATNLQINPHYDFTLRKPAPVLVTISRSEMNDAAANARKVGVSLFCRSSTRVPWNIGCHSEDNLMSSRVLQQSKQQWPFVEGEAFAYFDASSVLSAADAPLQFSVVPYTSKAHQRGVYTLKIYTLEAITVVVRNVDDWYTQSFGNDINLTIPTLSVTSE
jgi:hypothetical protein